MNIKSKTVKLKVELLKNGLSIVDLSKKVSIDPSYSNQIVNGKRNPSPKLAKRIAETLGVEITDIFTIEINKEDN